MRAPSAEPRSHAPPGLPLARPGSAERLGLAGGATRGLCCGHLGRSSGASQRFPGNFRKLKVLGTLSLVSLWVAGNYRKGQAEVP